jgi:hypothetical protein
MRWEVKVEIDCLILALIITAWLLLLLQTKWKLYRIQDARMKGYYSDEGKLLGKIRSRLFRLIFPFRFQLFCVSALTGCLSILLFRNDNPFFNFVGGFLVIQSSQLTLWTMGLELELLGNVARYRPEAWDDSETRNGRGANK